MVIPKATAGYYFGINRAKGPDERPRRTGGEQFAEARQKRRMAGDILNLSQSPGAPATLSLPTGLDVVKSTGIPPQEPLAIGEAELRAAGII